MITPLHTLSKLDTFPPDMLCRQGRITTTERAIQAQNAFYNEFYCARETRRGAMVELYGFHILFSVLEFDEPVPEYEIVSNAANISVVRKGQ